MPSEYNVTVTLNEDLKQRLVQEAREEMISISAVVRKALKRYFLPSKMTNRKGKKDAA